jgi:hypothetical protein
MRTSFDSTRGRVAWSVAAVFVLVWWEFMILAADATAFYAPTHTLKQTLAGIASGFPEHVWPGAMGRDSNPFIAFFSQLGPFVALLSWCGCLIKWERRRTRALAVVTSMLAPMPMAIIAPPLVLLAPIAALVRLGSHWDGETYEELGWCSGLGLWWYLHLGLLCHTFLHKLPRRPGCPKCGYSTAGLKVPVCPECGTGLWGKKTPAA